MSPAHSLADAFVGRCQESIRGLPVSASLNTEDYDYSGLVDLSGFDTDAAYQNRGHGTEALSRICMQADRFGIDLEVYVGIAADGCDPERLIIFYSRAGFILQNAETWAEYDEGFERPYLIRRANKS